MHRLRNLSAVLLLAACTPAPDGCVRDGETISLHDDVREASGIAWSRNHRNTLWLHNDSDGGAVVHAVDPAGEPIGSVTLNGARNRDWEDLAVARCPGGGPEGDCIYVGDIGDNRASREGVGVWVAAEPDPRADDSVDAVFFRFTYPDGARDAEAFVVLEDGSLVVVSKGREHPITVYRSDPLEWPAVDSARTTMRLLHRLSDEPVDLPLQITGASRAERGGAIALRSYSALQFYRLDENTLRALLAEPVALDSLVEPQGEGVAIGPRGRVALVSEAGPQAIAPRLTPLRCRIP